MIVAAPSGPGVARAGDGLEVIDVDHRGLFGSPGAWSRLFDDPRRALGVVPFARAIDDLVRATAPTTIVAHWFIPSGVVARAAGGHVALELVAHGADVRLLSRMPRFLARNIIHWLCDGAAVLRVVSAPLAERLATMAPSIAERLVIAPMPLALDDPALAARVRAKGSTLRSSDGEPLHVVAARLVPSKRVERAIDHVQRVGGRLVLVGDGPSRARLIEYARARRVTLRMAGALAHEDALAWISAADVVLAPLARDEGAPTVVREARALGREVIVFS